MFILIFMLAQSIQDKFIFEKITHLLKKNLL